MPPVVQSFLDSLMALLVIFDPAGTAALFIAMTRNQSAASRARQARRACLVALAILSVFGIAGERFLLAIGISLPALKVAGGILLFLTGAEMATARRTARREEQAQAPEEDISVFPLGIPLIAGPGAMTTIVLLHSAGGSGPLHIGAIELALVVALGVLFCALLLAQQLGRLLGETGSSVIGRVLGILIAALAAQIAIDGLRQSLLR